MKKFLSLNHLFSIFAVAAIFAATTAPAQIAAQWTFEGSFASITGSSPTLSGLSPEVGTGTASGVHASTATWSSPAGNGSTHSFSVNTWAVGDYFQFQTSTLGLNNILVSFDQTSSGTGPRDFKLTYSTDGTTFSQFASDYMVLANASPNPVWNATTASSIYSYSFNLSAVTALNNASAVYFRVVDDSTISANGGTVATTGTDRLDNFTVQVVPVPEPNIAALAGFGVLGLILSRRSRL